MTLTSVDGGECVGAVYQGGLGTQQAFTAMLTQSGSTVSGSIVTYGVGCRYSGTAAADSVALSSTFCDAVQLSLRCPNGPERDMHVVVKNVNADLAGGAMTGRFSETWNVFDAGTENKVGTLVLSGTFSGRRP